MIELRINGVARKFDGDPEMPLLWYLRDDLGLTGTKFGCGMGLCGGCTVHVNGTAVRSCVTTMRNAAGQRHHDHRRAWARRRLIRCRRRGRKTTCRSADIARAVRSCRPRRCSKQKPKPTDKDIDDAMAGNICRCGTYQRIRAAIKTAAGVTA